MAGSYADAPGRLFPADVDGSSGFYVSGASVVTALTTVQMQRLMGEVYQGSNYPNSFETGNVYCGYIFPELRTLTGYYYDIELQSSAAIGAMQYSSDTTNGLDGSWTNIDNPATGGHYSSGNNSVGSGVYLNAKPSYRTVRACTVASCKAVRLLTTAGSNQWRVFGALHFYGSVVAGQTPDRLTLWDPSSNVELSAAGLDWGDVVRGSTTDKTFRVKNNSGTLTANSVLLSYSSLTDASPTFVSQETLGIAGSFAATQTITSIAPGAISAVVTARLIVSSAAALSVYRQRLTAAATTWS